MKHAHFFASGLLALLAVLLPGGGLSAAPNVDPSAVVAKLPPRFLDLVAAQNRPDSSGAAQHNRGGQWRSVNFQIGTDRLVTAGLAERKLSYIADALHTASYAFAHQTPDGGFSDTVGYMPAQRFGAAGGFTVYLAHSLLMLQQSRWFQQSPQTAQLRARARALYTPLRSTLNFLIANQAYPRADRAATNRIISYGAEYYLAGRLLGDPTAIEIGRSFLGDALGRQMPDGTFPEVGGFDSSYQNVSLYFAQITFLQMPTSDPLREALWSAIQRGFARENANVLPTGEISTLGNTRIGQTLAVQRGQAAPHRLDSGDAVLAYSYYAAITGDPGAHSNVQQILAHYFNL